jgi:hypothetical protein
MPEVVLIWREAEDLKKCGKRLADLIETYRQDFSKYVKKFQIKYVELIFSLHLFLKEKSSVSSRGVRFSGHPFSVQDYLHSYPLYAVANLMRHEISL